MTDQLPLIAGASGRVYVGRRNRTGRERLDAIRPTLDRQKEFEEKLAVAAGDPVALADLMAEAIDMLKEANGAEAVGRDGRVTASMEDVIASICAIKAREAYLLARKSNHD